MFANLGSTTTSTMQNSQTQALNEATPLVSGGMTVINLLHTLSVLLIFVGLVVGILYMIKSKKTKGKRIFIGLIIIGAPFILYFILKAISFNMLLNMYR